MKQRIWLIETLEIVHWWTIGNKDPEEAFLEWLALQDRNPEEYSHAEEPDNSI